jgi:hypothetical protein
MPRTPHDRSPPASRDGDKREKLELERRYGSIGIPAVAAAARYSGEARNPAYAPAAATNVRQHEDAAA